MAGRFDATSETMPVNSPNLQNRRQLSRLQKYIPGRTISPGL
jgi:hypothetical protein